MTRSPRRRVARIVVPALAVGGACGAGVALGLYPPAVGVAGAVVVGAATGWAIRRARSRPA